MDGGQGGQGRVVPKDCWGRPPGLHGGHWGRHREGRPQEALRGMGLPEAGAPLPRAALRGGLGAGVSEGLEEKSLRDDLIMVVENE